MHNPFDPSDSDDAKYGAHILLYGGKDARGRVWSAAAVYADWYSYNYDHVVYSLTKRNANYGWYCVKKDWVPLPIPSPTDFLEILEFRKTELERVLGSARSATELFSEIAKKERSGYRYFANPTDECKWNEWHWPKDWFSEFCWNTAVVEGLHNGPSARAYDELKTHIQDTTIAINVHKSRLGISSYKGLLCDQSKVVSEDVFNFITNVQDLKEESITDYFVWKFHKTSGHFHYVNVHAFTRQQEGTQSGADFELEFWMVGSHQIMGLLVQAKMMRYVYDGYCRKFNYRSSEGRQIDILLSYASKYGLLPFYLFYTAPHSNPNNQCCGSQNDTLEHNCSLYLCSALDVKDIADTCFGKPISRDIMLSFSYPLTCLFCCPDASDIFNYLSNHFPSLSKAVRHSLQSIDNLPPYVRLILSKEFGTKKQAAFLEYVQQYSLQNRRFVAALELDRFAGSE